MPAKKPKIQVPCANCGRILERLPSRLKYAANQFCNYKCKGAWNALNNRGENHPRWVGELSVNCDHCGKDFRQKSRSRLARNGHNFCSRECSAAWSTVTGRSARENNPQWKPPIIKPCDTCGKTVERQHCRVGTGNRTHHFCSKKCKYTWIGQHITENFSGANSHMWRGGAKYYHGPNWNEQARKARKRDGYKCQHCGIAQKRLRRQLDVHHVVPFRTFGYVPGENDTYLIANNLNNLISLCQTCHLRAEYGKIPIQPVLLSILIGTDL